jgi:trans-aconitate methyltransferase
MFQMMVDIALEPRSVLAANVAKAKNQKTHDLEHHLAKFDPNHDNAPKKCLIVASGVKNHNEYVELVKERLGEVLSVPEH